MNDRTKALERPRYFPRQMITPDDLASGTDYLRARLRRHNRALHGWGIVYGAMVQPLPDNNGAVRKVRITPGFILTPQGEEIEILSDHCFDATRAATAGSDADGNDPWSSNIYVDRRDAGVKYLAIRYSEVPTRPIRVSPSACGCGTDSTCENSRLQDGYVIDLLDTLPASYDAWVAANEFVSTVMKDVLEAADDQAKVAALLKDLFSAGVPVAPSILAEPWVVLAKLTFQGGVVRGIDPIEHRRMVVSAARLWWKPVEQLSIDTAGCNATAVVDSDPKRMKLTVEMKGQGFSNVSKTSVQFIGDNRKPILEDVKKFDDTKFTISAHYPVIEGDPLDDVVVLIVLPDGLATFSDRIAIATTAAPPPGP